METIQIHTINRKWTKLELYLSLIILIICIIELLAALFFNHKDAYSPLHYLIFSMYGLMMFSTRYFALKADKYFIKWDEEEIVYAFP